MTPKIASVCAKRANKTKCKQGAVGKKTKTKTKTTRKPTYFTYIYEILKEMYPDTEDPGNRAIYSFVNDVFGILATADSREANFKRLTVSSRQLESEIRELLSMDVIEQVMDVATKDQTSVPINGMLGWVPNGPYKGHA